MCFNRILKLTTFHILGTFLAYSSGQDTSSPQEKLAELGIVLKTSNPPVANYVPAVRSGNLIFLAGAIAKNENGTFIKGKLGENMTVEEAYQVSRKVAIALLTSLMSEIGDLEKVERIVKVEGYVNATPGFEKQSLVINGCSDLLVEVFGDKGKHARIAIGANSLPFGAPVEIAAIVEIKEE